MRHGGWGFVMRFGGAVFLSALFVHIFSPVSIADPLIAVPAITCADGATERVPLRSTYRLPEASGTIMVERMGGTTGIEVKLDSMKPAMLFGGDYNTYVLWLVPPGGAAENRGEITLDGSRASAGAETSHSEFAIIITAEPHFLVSAPSAFVVLENEASNSSRRIQQPLIEGVYNFDRSSLDQVQKARGKIHTDVKQAFTAVRLADRSNASTLAAEEFAEAQRALQQTIAFWRERRDRSEIAAQARETVRLAVAAQRLAQERAF
jgi:hypothetical protein